MTWMKQTQSRLTQFQLDTTRQVNNSEFILMKKFSEFFLISHLIYVNLYTFLFDLGMFDLATNWSEPSSTTNPEMNQM